MADRTVGFEGSSWDQLMALPRGQREPAANAITRLLEEPVPLLAEPFPERGPLPGAYELHLPSDGVTIWYTITPRAGKEYILIQYVAAD